MNLHSKALISLRRCRIKKDIGRYIRLGIRLELEWETFIDVLLS